MIDLIDSCVIL